MRQHRMDHPERTDDRAAAPGPAVCSLARLRGYRITPGDPDVHGWQVYAADGRNLGQVDDLLVDTAAMQVRYLQVRLERTLEEGGSSVSEQPSVLSGGSLREHLVRETLSDLENQLTAEHRLGGYHYAGERHILLPIGRARLDTETDRIVLDDLQTEDVLRLPVYQPGTLDRDFEECLRQALDGTWRPEPDSDFYAHDLYDEARFYRSRRSRTESVLSHRGQ
jgi:photosynthetic reaction center H subunit